MSSGQAGHGHYLSLKKSKESDENYDKVLKLKPDYQLAKYNQKIVKRKLYKNKTTQLNKLCGCTVRYI